MAVVLSAELAPAELSDCEIEGPGTAKQQSCCTAHSIEGIGAALSDCCAKLVVSSGQGSSETLAAAGLIAVRAGLARLSSTPPFPLSGKGGAAVEPTRSGAG